MIECNALCKAVEKKVGMKPTAPSHFKKIAEQIEERTKEHISYSTLMRLWGAMKGVEPRRVTLDILAHFLGYMSYDDFVAHQPVADETERSERSASLQNPVAPEAIESQITSETIEAPITPNASPSKSSWMKQVAWAAVAAVVVLVGGVFLYKLLSAPPAPVYVTDLSQLSNTKQYIIHTRHDMRGLLGVLGRHLGTTFTSAQQNRCEAASPFAILFYEGSYYLFSVEDSRFINVGVHEDDAPLAKGDPNDCSLDIHQEADSCFVIDFKNCKTVCSLNVNSVYGPFVTDYGTINGMFDEGNLFMLEEVGDFDPTEAMRMLQDRDQEYKAALKTITEGRYRIHAEGSQARRFYLRADGYLTETPTDSCIFTIQQTDSTTHGDPKYRVPAWRIFYEAGEGVDAHNIGFECPHLENEAYVPCYGRLCIVPISNHVVQDEVLFLGDNGCYAIRSTNLATEAWGCGLYLAVYDLNGDGKLEVDYSSDRAYVWRLEKMSEK